MELKCLKIVLRYHLFLHFKVFFKKIKNFDFFSLPQINFFYMNVSKSKIIFLNKNIFKKQSLLYSTTSKIL